MISNPTTTSPANQPAGPAFIVNDFSITAATKNGSGSQTANLALLRALFKMGIPVSGKNLFPSNIQGRPTWYTIRTSGDGFIARRDESEIVVALNPDTALEDHDKTATGGAFIYEESIKMPLQRDDISYYPIPAKRIAAALEKDPKLKTYSANMVYVGVLMWLLGIEEREMEAALMHHFKGKQKPVDSNMKVVRTSIEWAQANLTKTDLYRVERIDKTKGLIMIDGNTAGALGAIYGGVNFVAWYPITPATSVADGITDYLPRLRIDSETKAPTYAVIQSEDELAALGMVLGAGWAGARSMTSTSGPGISLMAEFSGLGYFAEIPAVIWDVQRMGPATGLPTRVSQGDILKAYWLGHGDTKHVILLPGDPFECFEMGWRAFDLAERLQTPVFVLSDLDIGMNQWMCKPFEYPTEDMDRGKVLTAEQITEMKGFARYKDVDGDGIGWRTLPGTNHPLASYFTRGSGHNERAQLSERSEDWEHNMERLTRKFETARALVPAPQIDIVEGADIGIICFGSTMPAVEETRELLARKGVKTSMLRLRALPMNQQVHDFIGAHKRTFVVEMNTDAQLASLLTLHAPEFATRLVRTNNNSGLPVSAAWLIKRIEGAK
jgi:2-oxoglutarate ferredoxin oxidoreductase subunit alpha